MHELSVASSIFDHVLDVANAPPPKKIYQVIVRVGEMSCVEPEQLIFSYDAISKETPLEGSALLVEKTPVQVTCPHCSYQGAPKYWEAGRDGYGGPIPTLQCPKCGQTAEATEGHDCAIKTIRYAEL